MKKLMPLALLLAGCGIRANPQVLKHPEVEIRRIGEKVYVKSLSGEIRVRGFERQGNYWVRVEGNPFCFTVERLGEGSRRFCVEQAREERPSIRLVEEESHVAVIPSGFESYRLYALREGSLLLETVRTVGEHARLERDYWERCYALTGLRGNVESRPVEFCIKPKPPPTVPEVEGLELRRGRHALYLLWFYEHHYREFVIYRDGKEVGRTGGFAFETGLPEGRATFTIKVVSPAGFESKGRTVDYSP